MSTTTRQNTTKKSADCTPGRATRWSAEKARIKLSRSYTKLCTHAGPTPWAEVETTEE